ncbi:MAG: RimK family alpha-L-glutamate ligase [Acidobacteria bacterium]|nr:RimK family alpha-L-glutamate ligase [Acidobacteriota bacterium]
MGFLLLSARPGLEVNRRLVKAASARGVELRVADLTRMSARCGPETAVYEDGRQLRDPEAVLARVGNWRPASALAVLEAFESRGVPTPNPSRAVRAGRDHWRTVELLGRAGLPVPPTLAGSDPERLAAAAVDQLGLPVVVKQRRSRMGVGVILCRQRDHLEAVLDSLWRLGDEVAVQSLVPTGGLSFRVFVAGGGVVAGARFHAARGEWRSNAARGAQVEAWQPGAEAQDLAVRAASVLGLGIAGVDLLPGPGGLVIGEVNPSPGFKALERATGADIAGAIVAHMVGLARAPGS